MRIEAAFVDFLRRSPGVLPLTGGGKMIFKGRAPPDADNRRLHYWLASEKDYYLLDGRAAGQPTANIRVQALGRGQSGYEDAAGLADAVAGATGGGAQRLKEFVAGWFPPSAPAGSQLFVQCVRVAERVGDGEEMPAAFAAKSIFIVDLDVTISYVAG